MRVVTWNELSAENRKMMWVPPGFAHGFYVMSESAEFVYKCTDYYAPECDGAVRFDDPGIGIDWGLNGPAVLSDKDAAAPLMKDWDNPFK